MSDKKPPQSSDGLMGQTWDEVTADKRKDLTDYSAIEKRVADSQGITMEFREMGGYDCMTGAWVVCRGFETLAVIDQGHFGQRQLDFDFRSPEAKAVAGVVFEALKVHYTVTP